MRHSPTSESNQGQHTSLTNSRHTTPLFSLYRFNLVVLAVASYLLVSAVQTEFANRAVQTTLTRVLQALAQQESAYGSYQFLDGSNVAPKLPFTPGLVALVPRTVASTRPGIVSISTPPSHHAMMVTLFEESRANTCWAIAQVLPSQQTNQALFHVVPTRATHNYYTAIHGVTGCSWNDNQDVVGRASSWHTSWPPGWTW